MKRACIERGCPNYTTSTRCTMHARAKDAVRQAKRGDRYKGDYRKRRADTLAEQPYCSYGYPGCTRTERLTADHLADGSLVTACLHCNVVRANRARAHRAWGGGRAS